MRSALRTVMCGVWLATAMAPAWAAGDDRLPDGSRRYQLSLKQLGAAGTLALRGVEGSNTVPFSVRTDEVVSAARLRLTYAYSPALLADLSHINVLVNGEVAASLPVPKEAAGTRQERVIDIPARLITEFNRLTFQLIGHYTMQCENPLHSSLWATISTDSTLELTVAPLPLKNDLGLLPVPFFDPRDARRLTLPIVLPAAPDNASLEAAGTLSSWFGAMAGYRGAVFPASLGQIPRQGNAIVLMNGGSLPGIDVPPLSGPTVAIVANPNDPASKLLLIMGRDSSQLKTAAKAVAVGNQALSGAMATITDFKALAPREPYDAPRWLRTDRPVKLGELARAQNLNVSGYTPDAIRIPLAAPPDLFAWRERAVPVRLNYRYTPRPARDKSTLNVAVDGAFVSALPILTAAVTDNPATGTAVTDGTLVATGKVNVPLAMITPQSQLQLNYFYDYTKKNECEDVLIDNMRGAIAEDSTIDLTGSPHFIAMPDLNAFRNSGFPFTRLADLSQTGVVLAGNAGQPEIGAYLTLLGRMGASTGYPATDVTVVRADQVDSVSNKDLLVISAGRDQALLKTWSSSLPFGLEGSKRYTLSDLVYRVMGWLGSGMRPAERDARIDMAVASDSTDAVFAGFESPVSNGRSVVVMSSNRADGLLDAVNALMTQDADPQNQIRGGLAIVRGTKVDSLVDQPTYHVGRLPPLMGLQWYLSQNPLMLGLFAFVGIGLLAGVAYLALRSVARRRLGGN
ncbi:cellulose biosynthesis cyclic di-GMP-binding regulatory protein BcsB [Pigmentiphaga litoralis]|uniref:cellulose biosynthesis cyclic di-GMP-binding regulatory protein BcsB n=1 Tax=Pigmentiphaga litoralis TaxID=516702 RepID=UPI003B43975E